MNVPVASVIVPTYNRVDDVCGAIASVLAQTLRDFELIVVDDGSTDDTRARIARDFAGEARLRYLRTENRGTAVARNHGLDRVRGRYVGLLDSDDRYVPEFLAHQVAQLERRQDAHLVLCDGRYVDAAGDQGGTVFADPDFHAPLSIDAMYAGAWGLPSCCLFRADALTDLRFDPAFRYAEDTELLFRFFAAGRRAVLNDRILTLYRHGGSDSGQKTGDRIGMDEDHVRMMELHCPDHPRTSNLRYRLARRKAKAHLAAGRLREARPGLWRWWRHRPWSRQANRGLLRAYFGRAR